MPMTSSLINGSARVLGHVTGQITTSIVAALAVAAATHALWPGDAHEPTVLVVERPAPAAFAGPAVAAPPGAAAVPVATPLRATLPVFALGGPQLPLPLAHAFPLDGDPTFQASLSRPFVALATAEWRDPGPQDQADAALRRKPRVETVTAAPATPQRRGPIQLVADVVPLPSEQAKAPEPRRLLGIALPERLPSLADVVDGVTTAGSALTGIGRFW